MQKMVFGCVVLSFILGIGMVMSVPLSQAREDNLLMTKIDKFQKFVEVFPSPIIIPDIPFQSMMDTPMTLVDFEGSVVVLNLWATWCPPCVKEMPTLQALQDKYPNGDVKIVGISLDRGMDGQMLRSVLADKEFGPVAGYYGDWLTIKDRIQTKGLPTTYIINKEGRAVARIRGEVDWDSPSVHEFIASLLAQG